jgi:hypothetical protein
MRVLLVCLLSPVAFGQFLSERWDQASDTYIVKVNPRAARLLAVNTGTPYSAVVIWQQGRPLADGMLSGMPPTVTKTYRDSQGRTRSDTARPGQNARVLNGRFTSIEIWDPVGRFVYILDEEGKVAHRFSVNESPRPAAPPRQEARQVEKIREALGWRSIEGVMAEGTKETKTSPVVTTNEEWYSPELKRSVLLIYTDPRIGQRVRRVTNLSRAEPDPAVFQPPPGYSVVDENESITITLKRR